MAQKRQQKKDSQQASPADGQTTGAGTSELEQVRTLLFGNQTRTLEKRLDELEQRMESTRDNLSRSINDQREDLQQSLADQRQALTEQLATHEGGQTIELQKAREEFRTQNDELVNQLGAFEKKVGLDLNKLETDFQSQMKQARKEINDRLDKLSAEINERLRSAQVEARERDDDLRQELLTMGAWLDGNKAARTELGQMMVAMGEQLQQKAETPPEAAEDDL